MVDPIPLITATQDKLFDKMASSREGWSVKSEGFSKDVPLNKVDYFATRLLSRTIDTGQKTVLAVPRITPGTALGLAAYLAVNRFIDGQTKGYDKLELIFQGYQFAGIDPEVPLVIITKRRNLRDYFQASELRFNSQMFPFASTFPLMRINRLGRCVPLLENENPRQVKAAPIIFYHFDHFEQAPSHIQGAIVLVELDESVTSATFQRLTEFLSSASPKAVFALASSFDKNQLQRFAEQGFRVITLTPSSVARIPGHPSEMPSLASSLHDVPEQVEVTAKTVIGQEVDECIARIARNLIEISDSLKGDLPRVYYTARTIFSILKNLAVPLDLYEDARRKHPYYKTLKYNLKTVFGSPYLDVSERQEVVIKPIWASLGSDFLELYELLLKHNAKYEGLTEQAKSSEDDKKVVIFYDPLQAEIFKFLIKDTQTTVSSLKEAHQLEPQFKHFILTGVWRKFDENALFSLLPSSLDVVCYISELRSIEGALKRLNDFRQPESKKGLVDLGWAKLAEQEEEAQEEWVHLDEASKLEIKEAKHAPQTNEEYPSLDAIFEEMADGYYETEDLEEAQDQGYLVTLDSGEIGYLIPGKEILVYADKNSVIGPVTPEYLQKGDYLLTVDAENNSEIFAGLVERTRKLTGADAKVITFWETAMLKLRRLYGLDEEALFIRAMQLVGCKRTESTIKQWLRGRTLAPQDAEDIQRLLKVSMSSSSPEVAEKIATEMGKVRSFHRRLGRRLQQRMTALITENNIKSKPSLIDAEIDEILDLTHTVCIKDISGPESIPKGIRQLNALS